MAKANEPVAKVRYGRITAAIWENQGENGTWHNVTLTRSYKDGDKLKDTSSLSGSDLLVGAEALRQAYVRIQELRSTERASEEEAA